MVAAEIKKLPYGFRCNSCKWCGSGFRVICPGCGGTNLVKVEISRVGKVVDFVPVLYPPDNLRDLGQYVSVLVQFNEGFKKFGISLGKPEDLFIGCSVVVSAFDEETKRLFVERA
jgi:uncharacterized OB-fold protein